MSKRAPSIVLTLALSAFAISIATIAPRPADAAIKESEKDKEKPLTVSKKVGVALQAAQAAIAEKKFDEAAEKIKEADEVSKKTDFDQFQINEFRAYLYANQNSHFDEIVDLYEKSLETPQFFSGDSAKQRIKQLVVVTYNAKKYDKTVDYAKQWLADHPDDKSILDLLGRVYYVQKDYQQARQTEQKLIDLAESGGEKPEELWLQLVQSCAGELDDEAGIIKSYEKLVRYYPKPDYWDRLLAYNTQNERSEAVMLGIFRLQADLDLLTRPSDYVEYAQLAMEKAMPGEALKVVQAGFDKKILGVDPKEKEREQLLLSKAKQKAASDRAQIPTYEKEAQSAGAKDGRAVAGLGLAYFSYDMYEQAISALEKGLQMGGLKDPDGYRLVLGISYLRKGDAMRARAEFEKVVAGKTPLAKSANLWALRTYN